MALRKRFNNPVSAAWRPARRGRGWRILGRLKPPVLAMKTTDAKIPWRGKLTSVQPRIRLTRSFDQVSHTYLGYALRVDGIIGDENLEFWIGVGKGAHAKHQFEVDLVVSGECLPVANPRLETVGFYKVSKLAVHDRTARENHEPPPWIGVPPELPSYRARGHRRLRVRTYDVKCSACLWGCRMAVEMIIDQWNPSHRRYRTETFCYGPKSCPHYKAGPKRKVPGRRGMTYVEEDWVDEDATAHRSDDE
jgi:hypothetical protein